MIRCRTLLAVVAVQFLALAALAQSEFGRASTAIDAVVKQPRRTSGSLELRSTNFTFSVTR